MNVCGIDVSKKTLDVAIIINGESSKGMKFENTTAGHKSLVKYLHKRSVSHACIEATGHYHLDMALMLDKQDGIQLMVVNPKVAHNFAKVLLQKAKTDKADALVLAQFVLRMDFIQWQAPDESLFAIRSCSRRLSQLTKMQTNLKNQLHACQTTDFTPEFIIQDIIDNLKQIKGQIQNLINHTVKIIEQNHEVHEKYKCLIGVNGIAEKTAIKLLGELALLDPEMKSNELVAHAGLNPTIIQSGSSVNKKSRISKTGNKYIREALYMTALRMAHHDENVSAYYQHLINDNHLAKRQAICAVMRKLLMAINCMLRTNTCFDSNRFYRLAD